MEIPFVEPLHFTDANGVRLFVTTVGDRDGDQQPRVVFRIEEGASADMHVVVAGAVVSDIQRELLSVSKENSRTFDDGYGTKLTIRREGKNPVETLVWLQITDTQRQSASFGAPLGLAKEIFDYAEWIADRSATIPSFMLRIRKAFKMSDPQSEFEDCVSEIQDMQDHEIAKVLMNLCVRGRIDLSVKLLERFSRRGRMHIDPASAVSQHDWERPADVSWDDLVNWSGADLDLPKVEFIERQEQQVVLGEYQAYDYVSCFESAFDEEFESISFDTLDFRDVQARLRRLDELLDAYFDQVVYPTASTDEVIPLSTRKTSGKADSRAAVQCSGKTETAREPASLTSQGVS